jgi:hypothetical protein
MDGLPSLSKSAFIERMRGEVERVLGEVAEAVNQAPAGQLITASEEKVRDLMGELRRRVYETAVQMRVEEGERSFSPSAQCGRS